MDQELISLQEQVMEKNETELLSIVVSAYNAEKYIQEMVDSLIRQTYSNKEIILVDDGSKDGTPQICDEYASNYDFIHVIHKKNEGVYSARNTGLEGSKGAYIAFVDADDYIDCQAYETMMNAIIMENGDVVSCGYKNEYSVDRIIEKKLIRSPEIYVYTGANNILSGIGNQEHDLCGFVWNKIFRRTTIGNVRFSANAPICDDMVFVYDVLSMARKAVYVDQDFYHYRYVGSSLSKSGSIDRFMRCLSAMEDLAAWSRKEAPWCQESLAKTIIFWNVKTCEQMLKRFDQRAFRTIQKNIGTYKKYIPQCTIRIRMLSKAILKSWYVYKPLGLFIWYMKKAYVTYKRLYT